MGDGNIEDTAEWDTFNESLQDNKTKGRATSMSSPEMCILSQLYVDNYSVWHGSANGASKDNKSRSRKTVLEEMVEGLLKAGYQRRTTAQVDQRVRDCIKKAKDYLSSQKKEAFKTGGGMARKIELPPHIKIIIDNTDSKPRLNGIPGGLECGAVPLVHVKREGRPPDSDANDQQVVYEPPQVKVLSEIPQNFDVSLSSFAPTSFPSPTRCSTPMSSTGRKRQKFESNSVKASMSDEKSSLYIKERERIELQMRTEETRHLLLKQQLENKKILKEKLQHEREYWALLLRRTVEQTPY